MNRPAPKYLQIGQLLRPHGVHGEMRMRVVTDYPERLPKLERVYLALKPDDPHPKPYTLKAVRFQPDAALVTLEGVNDRDAAERLRQLAVLVAIEDAVPLEEGEVYLYQLFGMRVVTEDGTDIGEVIDVLETGANDNYLVASEHYGEYTLPDIPQVVLKIDAPNNRIIVRLMEGLLPE